MEHQAPPPDALVAYPEATQVDFGPPPGVLDDECAHAFILVRPEVFGGEVTRAHQAFFRPTPEDLAALNAGGHVVVTLIGDGIQPFACGVFGQAG